MGKLIIVSFAFMAFAFYELSGGDDFIPIADEKRAALALDQADTETTRIAAGETRVTEQVTLAAAATPAPQVVLASATPVEQPDAAELANAIAQALDADKAEEVTQAVVQSVPTPEPVRDFREVSAARVNMRDGPGQNFRVVTKLNGGDEVEILQDPGDGWVKLRVVDGGREGWMADFLLTAANN